MTRPTLAELNRHVAAALLPETHAIDKRKGRAGAQAPAAPATPANPEYTPEQLAALAAAGITDLTSKSPDEIAAILAAVM